MSIFTIKKYIPTFQALCHLNWPIIDNFTKTIFFMEFKALLLIIVILFLAIDIIGSLPVIVVLKEKGNKIEFSKSCAISIIIMIVYLYVGNQILIFFNLNLQSFAVFGGLTLFALSLDMILNFPVLVEDKKNQDATFSPVAYPLIAGPGMMMTIFALKVKYTSEDILMCIIITVILVYFTLMSRDFILKQLSSHILKKIRKILGFILLILTIDLFFN